MIRVCLYYGVYCNNGSVMFNLLLPLLIVHCNVSIFLGYLFLHYQFHYSQGYNGLT